MAGRQPRRPFTRKDDSLLAQYIERYNPQTAGRMGNALYRQLTNNAENKWSFSSRHTWQSWRERYKNNQEWFDEEIARLQKKRGKVLEDRKIYGSSAPKPHRRDSGSEDDDTNNNAKAGPSKRKRLLVEEAREDRKKAKMEGQEERLEDEHEENEDLKEPEKRRGQEILRHNSVPEQSLKPRHPTKDSTRPRALVPSVAQSTSTSVSHKLDLPKKSRTNETDTNDVGQPSIYPDPDLSKAPSPFISAKIPEVSHSSTSVKEEPLTQEKLEVVNLSHFSHPSQEPTPPLSTVDVDLDVSDADMGADVGDVDNEFDAGSPMGEHNFDVVETQNQTADHEIEALPDVEPKLNDLGIKKVRKHVFPGGNYRMGLPARTDTLTISMEDSIHPNTDINPAREPESHEKFLQSKKILKRRQSSRDEAEDPFESIPPTPLGSESGDGRRQSKATLRLVEGPFGKDFAEGKVKPLPNDGLMSGDSDGEEDDQEEEQEEQEDEEEIEVADLATQDLDWLPRNRGKQKGGSTGDHQQHHPSNQPTQTQTQTVVKLEPEDHAQASTSNTLHPFEASQEHDHDTKQIRPRTRVDLKAFVDNLPEPITSRSKSRSRSVVSYAETEESGIEPRKPYVPSKELLAALATVQLRSRSSTANSVEQQEIKSTKITIPTARPFTFSVPHDSGVLSPNDPFLVSAMPRAVSDLRGKQKMKMDLDALIHNDKDRRRTFGGVDSRPPAFPDLNIAERLNKPHRRIFSLPRQSLPAASSSTSAAPAVHHSIPARRVSAPVEPISPSFYSPLDSMSAADAELAMRLGRAAIIQLISENRRFTEDTIMRVWQQEGSFERADARLKEMWEAAEKVFEAQNASAGDTAAARQKRTQEDSIDPGPRKSARDGAEAPKDPRRKLRQRRSQPQAAGLVYTPLPPENGHMSDYSPPQVSRAAQYRHPRQSVDTRARRGATSVDITPQGKQFPYTPAVSSPPMRSQSPEPPSSDGFKMMMRPITPAAARDVWGIEEERMLRSGDAATLQKLEARVGKMQYRRRMAETFKALR